MRQGIDSRAMFATFVTKLPGLLALAVAGAILGSGLNLLVVMVRAQELCYVSETEYYIDFAEGRYEARDHYNAFTWNDVLATDWILGRAMELLGDGYDRDQVRTMMSAEMLSDVRYLTVFVRGQEPAQVAAVRDALVTALEEFGARLDEFDAIYKIEDREIVREELPYFVWRPAFLGAVIAAGTGVFVTAFCFCMGSAFYTKGDITVRLGIPVCGMTFREGRRGNTALEQRQTEMLKEGLGLLGERYGEILLLDAADGRLASAFQREVVDRGLAGASSVHLYAHGQSGQENACSAVVAVIPFGEAYREKITDEIDHAGLCGCSVVAAVLVQSDRRWMRIYYAWREAQGRERTGRM